MAAGPTETERKPLQALTQKVLEQNPTRGKSQFQHFSEMSEVSITDYNRAGAMAEESLAVLSSYVSILSDFLLRLDDSGVADESVDEREVINGAIRKGRQILSPDYWTPPITPPQPQPQPQPLPFDPAQLSTSSSSSPPRFPSSGLAEEPPPMQAWPPDRSFEGHPFVKFSCSPAPSQTILTAKRLRIVEILDTIKLASDLVHRRCPEQLELEVYMPIVAINGPFFILAPSLCGANSRLVDSLPLNELASNEHLQASTTITSSLSSSTLSYSYGPSPVPNSNSLPSLTGNFSPVFAPVASPSAVFPIIPPPHIVVASSSSSPAASSSSPHHHHSFHPLTKLASLKKMKKTANHILPLQQPGEELYQAIKDNRPAEVLDALQKFNLDLGFQGSTGGWTLLHAACWVGNVAVVNALLDAGAPVTITSEDENLPFSYLVRSSSDLDLFERMWAMNPSCVAHRNRSGETALHAAILKLKVEVVAMLLRKGADTNVQTKRGESPLHYAVRLKNPTICSLLIEANADFANLKTTKSETALDLAQQLHLDDVIAMMLHKQRPQPDIIQL